MTTTLDLVPRYGAYRRAVGTFTVGQLAREAGVNVETIRYYERRGLLPSPPRTHAGDRRYSEDDIWRLAFVRRAKDLGFTLA
ncbi:MAG: MerR family transcriptional regulator, partial [Acidimicrobiia bacterium]|nr:MerR family transcriptional regulator [Acidimicrobiia bacterium]